MNERIKSGDYMNQQKQSYRVPEYESRISPDILNDLPFDDDLLEEVFQRGVEEDYVAAKKWFAFETNVLLEYIDELRGRRT